MRANLPTQLVFFHFLILPSPLSEPLAAARKKKENQATGVFFFSAHPPYPQFICVFVFVVIISSTLLLISNMKSLTTTSSNQDLPIDLPNTYKYPSSTHIGPAIQRISSRIVLLGQSHFFRSKIYGDDTVLGLISYICYPITKSNMCQHQIITLKSFISWLVFFVH